MVIAWCSMFLWWWLVTMQFFGALNKLGCRLVCASFPIPPWNRCPCSWSLTVQLLIEHVLMKPCVDFAKKIFHPTIIWTHGRFCKEEFSVWECDHSGRQSYINQTRPNPKGLSLRSKITPRTFARSPAPLLHAPLPSEAPKRTSHFKKKNADHCVLLGSLCTPY